MTIYRLMALTLTAAILCAGQTESRSLQAKLNMNGVKAYFKFTPLGQGPGACVEITGAIAAQAVKPKVGFEYHVHEKPVGPNKDCMATGGHLDPAKFGDGHCNPATPDRCQEGDLSGKHGNLKPTAVHLSAITYVDRYLQWEGAATTIVGRSIVVHNNGTRIACGDLVPVGYSSHHVLTTETSGYNMERQMVREEGDKFEIAAALTARHNGAISSLDERIAVWTLATSVAAGVVAALMAL